MATPSTELPDGSGLPDGSDGDDDDTASGGKPEQPDRTDPQHGG